MLSLKPTSMAVVLWLCAASVCRAQPADLVLRGGTVLTWDAADREAEAIAVRDGRIVAVGTGVEVAPLIGPTTRVVELDGRAAMPGFIEGHGHFLSLGRLRMDVDLTQAKSWDEVVRLIAAKAATTPKGEWIVGRGWHQEHWTTPPNPDRPQDRYPVHTALSAATPDHPVLLTHGTGHMTAANAAAMKLAGVDASTKDPPGGEILRDAAGNPTGVFRETAQSRIQAAHERSLKNRTPEELLADERRAFELATQECLAKGVTSFQDAGSSFEDIDLYRQAGEEGELRERMWVMLRASPETLARNLAKYRTIDACGGRLTVRAIKCMADGALGSHGALLLSAFDDQPESTGLRVQSLADIRRTAVLALEHDYQLCTHAIGDRANREVLDLYAEMIRSRPGSDLRWRIEHAQHLDPEDIPRFGDLGVIASMQANHATSDGPFVVTRLGSQRARVGAYAWRSLLDSGARIVNGTDTPVENVDPLLCFRSAVTRRMADGTQFYPEQCMTRREALRSYTIDAAYGAFQERELGSLEPGKRADVVVLSGNPLTASEEELGTIRVLQTIVGGQVEYERPAESR